MSNNIFEVLPTMCDIHTQLLIALFVTLFDSLSETNSVRHHVIYTDKSILLLLLYFSVPARSSAVAETPSWRIMDRPSDWREAWTWYVWAYCFLHLWGVDIKGMAEFCSSCSVVDTVRHRATAWSHFCYMIVWVPPSASHTGTELSTIIC